MTEKHDLPGADADRQETHSPWTAGDRNGPDQGNALPQRPGSRWLPDGGDLPQPSGGGAWRNLLPFGSGGNNGGIALWLILAAAVAWPGFTSFHTIAENERGVVSRLGHIDRVAGPGVAITWPAPFETVERVTVAEGATIDFADEDGGRGLLTADGNIVDAAWSMRWHVADAKTYVSATEDGAAYLRALGSAAMAQVMGSLTLRESLTPERGRLAARVHAAIQAALDRQNTGIALDGVQITDVRPPAALADDMTRIDTARANASKALTEAQANAAEMRRTAQNEAAGFDRVYAQYSVAPDVTRTRLYYETMEKILRRADLTIAPNAPATPAAPLATEAAAATGEAAQ